MATVINHTKRMYSLKARKAGQIITVSLAPGSNLVAEDAWHNFCTQVGNKVVYKPFVQTLIDKGDVSVDKAVPKAVPKPKAVPVAKTAPKATPVAKTAVKAAPVAKTLYKAPVAKK